MDTPRTDFGERRRGKTFHDAAPLASINDIHHGFGECSPLLHTSRAYDILRSGRILRTLRRRENQDARDGTGKRGGLDPQPDCHRVADRPCHDSALHSRGAVSGNEGGQTVSHQTARLGGVFGQEQSTPRSDRQEISAGSSHQRLRDRNVVLVRQASPVTTHSGACPGIVLPLVSSIPQMGLLGKGRQVETSVV